MGLKCRLECRLVWSKVPIEKRFLFLRVKPFDVVRYGYSDARNEEEPFERLLAERLKEFIRDDSIAKSNRVSTEQNNMVLENDCEIQENAKFLMEGDVEVVERAHSVGVVHFVGEHDVIAVKGSNVTKRFPIDYA
ncbi:hypothetical protein CQW23_22092 [Capsicum baccatum]|uniref:Uncharacterized protein n=1 Tax=Capsicum baccatum TaxID=33114 RepID=A0A2G2VZZ6_CAPBA|nr:hypothetical protein CQW23_22092 [Capsicum baccatum]